jgi:serine/threonine protein kinase/formylglycine-generating enzyme required for sulfatase activity
MTGTCPDADRIRGLVDGSLSDAEADELQLHIEGCQTCQAAIQELVADGSFWESVGEHLGTEQSSGPELERVMEELRQQSPEEAEQIGEAIELKLSFIDPPVEPGTIGRLQHYDILRVAGRGGMGIVVKAFDRSLRRVVAIKLLAPHLAGNGQARQRFVREGRAAAGICHEHVITIHAVEENPPYLVMQFVQGETLEARIHRNGALDFRETVRIAKQIAQGLAAAHAQGVVHRDIKPANILLENGVARVRITDFGLARAVDDASLTQSGVVAGTPQYMAPEQASGDAVDERADLFSLGSVIYTMLAGHAPFRATTAMGVLKRLCDHSARPIREINPEVPDWLVLIINRLHAKRPADRYQTADEVATLLERGLASLQHGHAPVIEVRSVENEHAEADSREVPAALDSTPSVQSSGKGQQARVVPRWLLRPIPLWIPLLPVPVFLATFISNLRSDYDRVVLAGIVTAATVLWLNWKSVARGFEPELIDETPTAAVQPRSRVGRFVNRARDLLPKSLHSLLFWAAAWVLPVVVLATAFAFEEDWAARGTQESLPDRGREMLATAVGVTYLWGVIAIVWFHRKRPNGSPLFPRGRARRVLFTLLLATVFCSYWLMVWFVDVQNLVDRHHARIAHANTGTARVEARQVSRNLLKLEFDQPLSGTAVIIELPNDEHYRFTSEQGGVLMQGVGSRSGTFPWRAVVGETEFATGDVTLAPDEVAEINIPQPTLGQLITGRWQTMPEPIRGGGFGMESVLAPNSAEDKPAVWLEFDSHQLLMVSHEPQANVVAGDSPRFHRSDFSIEIDDSVESALINLIGEDDRRIAGLVRFIPGHVSDGFGMEGASSMGMGMGGMTSFGTISPDRLELCLNDGSGPRPWEFKPNGVIGHELLRLRRSSAKESLREEMAYQPVPTGADPLRVTEAVTAWAKKLKIESEGTNSLGMELALIPPAEFKHMIPGLPGVMLPEVPTGPESNGTDPVDVSIYADPGGNPMFNVRPAQISVPYPFVIAREPVSIEQFRRFISETGYVTDAELGTALPTRVIRSVDGLLSELKNAPASASKTVSVSGDLPVGPGGWKLVGDEFVFESDLKWQTDLNGEAIGPARLEEPVTQISYRDAWEFCLWLSKVEGRQYRLPTSHEWAAAVQLGVTMLPPDSYETANDSTIPAYSNFDARAEHLLGLQTPASLFAEWTEDRIDPQHRLLARKAVSKDGNRFGWSPQYSAGQTFRTDSIGFRVVAELQVLSGGDTKDSPTEQP